MTRLFVALLLLGSVAPAYAQQPPPACEDRLIVIETLSAHKDQIMTSLVAQLRAAQKQLEDLRKAQEGDKK